MTSIPLRKSWWSEPSAGPRLTFFCELEPEPLLELFADPLLIPRLQSLGASISLGIMDFSPQRAELVRRLNQAGIPVVAWHLLPMEQGYWYHLGNGEDALNYYGRLREWTQEQGLVWDGMGLDLEPDVAEFHLMLQKKHVIPWRILCRCASGSMVSAARATYGQLVERIHGDGYRCDSYELAFLIDERLTGSELIQRLLRVTDLPMDRRVTMLYSSFFRPFGVGFMWQYARDAQSVGVGLTGGGIQLDGWNQPDVLTWDEFARDLRLVAQRCPDIHVFSLEGCVRRQFLERLLDFDWNAPTIPPRGWSLVTSGVRGLLRLGLRLSRLATGSRR